MNENRQSLTGVWTSRSSDTRHREIDMTRSAYANRIEVTDYMPRKVEDKDWIITLGAPDNAYVQPAEIYPTVVGGVFLVGHHGSYAAHSLAALGWQDPPRTLRSEVIGNFHYALPLELQDISSAIKEAGAMLKLEEDWDMNGALPVEKKCWEAAMSLLVNYSSYLFFHYSLIIPPPQIDSCPNGSVDLFWKEEKAQLLINCKTDANTASFYGDTLNGEDAIKGKIPTHGVKEYLAVWMKSLAG
jgi:hypothetical protein